MRKRVFNRDTLFGIKCLYTSSDSQSKDSTKNLLESLSKNQQPLRLHLGTGSQRAVSCGMGVHECNHEIYVY